MFARCAQLPARQLRMKGLHASHCLSRGKPTSWIPNALSATIQPMPASCISSSSHLSSCNNAQQTKQPQANQPETPLKMNTLAFWSSRHHWNRASINTTRCLIGCTLGDFSALWFLQANFPDLGMGSIMAISMLSGLTTSLLLETILLRTGADRLPTWSLAARTAAGMSLTSMLAMETVQNVVDYHLTGGVVDLGDPGFWVAAGVSLGAGWMAPLPWNYLKLRRWGKGCH